MDALVLEIQTRGLNRYHDISQPETRIGRALDNDIILSDPTVAPYHAKILRHDDGRLEIVNLADTNPTQVDGRQSAVVPVNRLPVSLEWGRIQARLLPRDQPVAATRALPANGNNRFFGKTYWVILLAGLCILLGGIDFYLNAYNSFRWTELIKAVLRDTVLTIGAFALTLAILERLIVHRWELRALMTTVCLMYLMFLAAVELADGLDYLFSADWPSTLLFFGWYLAAVPVAIALYLIQISHLPRGRSILLALLIASPITLPAMLQSPQLLSLFDSFSNAANYHQQLSHFDLRTKASVDIDGFAEQASRLSPGKPAE